MTLAPLQRGAWRWAVLAAVFAMGWCDTLVASPASGERATRPSGPAVVERADALADAGWYDRSLRHLADAVDANPSARAPRLALGKLLAELQRPADARKVLAPLLDAAGDATDREALVHLATAWAGADHGGELAALLEKHRGFVDASTSQGLKSLALLARGHFKQAAAIAESSLQAKDHPREESTLLHIVAARANERLGRLDAAQRRLERLAAERPHRPLAFDLHARLCLRHPRDVDPDSTFAQLDERSPHLTALARASLLTRARKLESARTLLHGALQRAVSEKHPAAIDLAHALAEVRFELGESTVPAFAPLVQANWLPATAILHAADWRERELDRPLSHPVSRQAEKHATPDELEVHEQIAERLWRIDERDAAIEAMQRLLQAGRLDAQGQRRLAAMLESRGRITEAIDVLESALDDRSTHAGLALQLAETLDRAGDLPAAETAYRRAMRLDPVTRARGAMRLQALFVRMGMPGEALLVLDHAAATANAALPHAMPHGLRAALHDRRAGVAFRTDHLDAAAESWRIAAKHPRHRGAARVGLARIALQRGDTDAAHRLLDRLVQQHPADALVIVNLPENASHKSTLFARADAAIDVCELALPDARRWLQHRFAHHGQAGQWGEAGESLARWHSLDDTSREAASLYAAMLVDAGEWETAPGVVKAAGLVRLDHPDPLTLAVDLEGRGGRADGELAPLLAAIVEGRADRAHASVRALPHALTVHRRDVHAMLERIDITDPAHARAARRLAAAVVALEHGRPRLTTAIASRVAEAHPRLTLAHALWVQGCWASRDSLDPAASAVKRDAPQSVLAHVVRAMQARESGDPDAARAALAEALRAEPGNAHLTYHLAEAEAEVGDVAGAIRRLAHLRVRSSVYRQKAAERLIELTLNHRPERYTSMGDWIERACGDSPARAVLAAAGRAAAKAGDHDRARRWLQQSLAMGQRDPATHLALAKLYEARTHRTWALRHLDAAIRADDSPATLAQARDLRDRLTQTAEVATE